MKELFQWVKRAALFLLGVILIVWGYQVNAGNEKPKEDKAKANLPSKEAVKPQPMPVAQEESATKRAPEATKEETKEATKEKTKSLQPSAVKKEKPATETVTTTVETEKKAEEASGSE
jgi:hypothetical protein